MLVPEFDLRRERFDRGLTLRRLAELIGVSRSTLVRIEQGAAPSAPVAKAIADWLGRRPSELWPGHDDASDQTPDGPDTSTEIAA